VSPVVTLRRPHSCGNIACENIFDFFTLVRVHLQQTADALASLLRRVVNVRTGIELAGINAEECQLTDKRIGHDLEDERGKRLFVVGLSGSEARRSGVQP
jgi:hypothetical protein